MNCTIYKSDSHDYTYVYLLEGFEFEELPEQLRKVFGKPEKVMDLELSSQLKLANSDTQQVMENLGSQGFHLQLPPKEDVSGWLDLPEPPGI